MGKRKIITIIAFMIVIFFGYHLLVTYRHTRKIEGTIYMTPKGPVIIKTN